MESLKKIFQAFDKGVEEKIFSPIGAIFLKKLLKNPGKYLFYIKIFFPSNKVQNLKLRQ